MKKTINKTILLIIALLFTGCSTVTGPNVTPQEIAAAKSELEVKALDFKIQQVKKINEIGYHLVESVPDEDIKIKPRPFLGLFGISRNPITERLFNSKPTKGSFIAFVLDNTPAATAGVKRGDILLAIDKKGINDPSHIAKRIYKLPPGDEVTLTIVRKGKTMDLPVTVEELPLDVWFSVVEEQVVNASAGTKQIFVTYGLISFANSDEEIAAVVSHELGHLSRGHVARARGTQLISAIASIGLGITAEVFSPGSGDLVMRGVGGIGDVFNSKFSRDLEREADYFSVRYLYYAGYNPEVASTVHERFAIQIPQSMISSYLSTHPSSPERKVRIQKTIEELRQTEDNKQ